MFWRLKKYDLRKPDTRFTSKIDRRIAANFDWIMFGMVVMLIIIGLVNLYSATRVPGQEKYFSTQFRWAVLGLIFLSVAFVINYRLYEGIGYWVYFALNFLLLLTVIFGPEIHGAKRWLYLGGLSFQPSELAKIGLVMALAKYLSSNKVPKGYNLREMLIPAAIIALPTMFVLIEPDLGTAVLMILIGMTVLFFAGIRRGTLLSLFAGGIIALPLSWFFMLKDYQRERILTLYFI